MEHIGEDIYVEFDIKVDKNRPVIYTDYLDNITMYTQEPTITTTLSPVPQPIIESTTIAARISSKKQDLIAASYMESNNDDNGKYRENNRKNMNRISVVALSTAMLAGGVYVTSFF